MINGLSRDKISFTWLKNKGFHCIKYIHLPAWPNLQTETNIICCESTSTTGHRKQVKLGGWLCAVIWNNNYVRGLFTFQNFLHGEEDWINWWVYIFFRCVNFWSRSPSGELVQRFVEACVIVRLTVWFSTKGYSVGKNITQWKFCTLDIQYLLTLHDCRMVLQKF